MGNFQSYSVQDGITDDGQPVDAIGNTEDNIIGNQGGVHRITIQDGEVTSTTSGVERFDSGTDFSPYAQEDWRSTARTSFGIPTNDINGGSVVTIGGITAKVSNFVQTGILIKQGDGYVLPGAVSDSQGGEQRGTQGQPLGAQATESADDANDDLSPDLAVMPEEVADAIDAAAAGIPQAAIQNGIASGIAAAMGQLTPDDIAQSIASSTGMEPSEAQGRVQFIVDAYQAQTDHFLTSKMGLSSEELQDFYTFVRQADNRGHLRQALESQLHGNSMAGWRPLVERYMSNVAPSSATLKARGFETQTTAEGETLVRISGTWMSVKAAAQAGIL
jgi:hypothetical protein